jgi:hypothetical protein
MEAGIIMIQSEDRSFANKRMASRCQECLKKVGIIDFVWKSIEKGGSCENSEFHFLLLGKKRLSKCVCIGPIFFHNSHPQHPPHLHMIGGRIKVVRVLRDAYKSGHSR